jgi:hypothetical protein
MLLTVGLYGYAPTNSLGLRLMTYFECDLIRQVLCDVCLRRRGRLCGVTLHWKFVLLGHGQELGPDQELQGGSRLSGAYIAKPPQHAGAPPASSESMDQSYV